MTQTDLGQRLVKAILEDFPDHQKAPPLRPIHTFGMGASGTFRASPQAKEFSVAEHFGGRKVPVTVRFSNGSGDATENDNNQDVHGMAVKFDLGDDMTTDLIAMTLGTFFVQNPEQFFEFTKAAIPKRYRRPGFLQRLLATLRLEPLLYDPKPAPKQSSVPGLMKFADKNRYARSGVIANGGLYAPSSWARAEYHAVHAFGLLGPDGVVRYGRLRWQPVAGIHPIPPGEMICRDGLRTDLSARLARWPDQFQLRVAFAEAGDSIDDPTQGWPLWRRAMTLGTLQIDRTIPDHEIEAMSFNPMRLVHGFQAPEGDAVLAARRFAYEASCERRNGTGCPVTQSTMIEETQ